MPRIQTIAIVSNLQIFVVGVPVLIILGDEPQTSFFMKSVIVWMNDLVVVVLIFGNLMWNVQFTDGSDDSSRNVSAFVSRGIHEYRENTIARKRRSSQTVLTREEAKSCNALTRDSAERFSQEELEEPIFSNSSASLDTGDKEKRTIPGTVGILK